MTTQAAEKKKLRPSRFFVPVAGVFGLALFFWLLTAPGTDRGPGPGTPAPPFELTDLGGRLVRLADYRGKVVLIDFWATWCVGCREELPALKALHGKLSRKEFVILAPSLDEGAPEVLARYLIENSIPYTVLFAEPDIIEDYRIFGLPTKYLINKEGVVHRKYLSDTPIAEVEADILDLLKRTA